MPEKSAIRMALNQKNQRIVLFGSFLAISIIPVMLLGWWVMDSARSSEYQKVEEKHLLVAKNLSLALSRYAQDILAVLGYIAGQQIDLIDHRALDLLRSQDISGIRVLNEAGEQTHALSVKTGEEPKPLTSAQLAAVRQALPVSQAKFLPVTHDFNGDPRLMVVCPIGIDNAVLVAEMSSDYFARLQGKIQFGQKGHAAIVDQAGNVIAHPKSEWVTSIKNISKVSAVQRMMNRETGVEQFYSPALKADMIAGLSFVEETGWGVMVPQPVIELEARIEQIKLASFAITAFGLALAVSISWFLSRRLAMPAQQLAAWQRAALDAADYCIISTDTEGVIATFNKKAEQMLGYSADELIGKETPKVIHDPDEVQAYAEILSNELGEAVKPGFEVFVRKARDGVIDEREWTYLHKNGSSVPVYLSVTALRSVSGEIIGFLGIATDLTERKAMLANLKETENLYQSLFNNAGDAIGLLDSNGKLVDCNPAMLRLFGHNREELAGQHIAAFSPDLQADGRSSMEKGWEILQAAFNDEQQYFDWLHQKKDGSLFDVEVSLSKVEVETRPYLQCIIRDITERKHLEKKLAFQAGHDSLTGLPNRKSLHEAFPGQLKSAASSGRAVAMMLLDLDRFKEINDTLGHHFGDKVLSQVGPRLREICKDTSITIARLGGDEFALLTTSDGQLEEIESVANSLLEAFSRPFNVGGFNVTVGASIGVAVHPKHGADSHELLRAADVAMYAAKKRSSGVVVYEPSIDEHSTQRLTIVNELNEAIKSRQLVLHYQPKINIATGSISGFEALVRWKHPTQGLVFPGEFLEIVEMSDLIHLFTKTVIQLAVSDKKKMRSMGMPEPVAINLSARNLVDQNCFDTLQEALASNGLDAQEVELELTESAVMQEPKSAVELLTKFYDNGIHTAIDDFGTGYSSLSYLRQLPVSALKIDRSFVMEMRDNAQDSAIVKSTIALAHSLDLKAISEGVEDDVTLELLRKMNCDEAQGYGICPPKPLDELVTWVRTYH